VALREISRAQTHGCKRVYHSLPLPKNRAQTEACDSQTEACEHAYVYVTATSRVSAWRLFLVDECQNIFCSKLVARKLTAAKCMRAEKVGGGFGFT